ncbi:MAG: AraC family transcriptional regulator ligand-binding domain-containing protein [Calditrichia bacterium]
MNQEVKFSVEQSWRLILKDLGINVGTLLRRASLPQNLFTQKNIRLTSQDYFRLWKALEESVNDPLFSLRVGQMISTEEFSPPIFAALCSPNLNIAMQRLSTYKKLIGPIVLDVDIGSQQTVLSIDSLYTANWPLPDSYVEAEITFLVHLVRLATREQIQPISIKSPSNNLSGSQFTKYFGVRAKLAEKAQISFSAVDAARPFLTENEFVWNAFEPELRNRLAEIDERISYMLKVQQSLFELLPTGVYSINEVAKSLAVSKRTLQRHLSSEQTTFQKVLNATRQKLAYHYLENPALSRSQISFLLGYEDANSFVRAFRSWTGKTPQKVRMELTQK